MVFWPVCKGFTFQVNVHWFKYLEQLTLENETPFSDIPQENSFMPGGGGGGGG